MAESRATLSSLLAEYDLQVQGVRVIQAETGKSVWQIETPEGAVALKRLHHDRDRSLFVLAAQQHIVRRGGNVVDVIPARNGDLVVAVGDGLYAAFRWISGRHPKPGDSSDLAAMVSGLARFHGAARGFTPPDGSRMSSKMGRWPEHFQTMNRQMRDCRTLLVRQLGSSAAPFLPLFDECLRQGDAALAALHQSTYAERQRIGEQEGPLCHQDYGERNCLLTPRGPYVLDLDGLTYDLQIRDVRKLMFKIAGTRGSWDRDWVMAVTSLYHSVTPLPAEDRRLLWNDLAYPHAFHAVVKNLRKGPVSPRDINSAAALERAKLRMLEGMGA